ncbi:MAG: AEC family transporter [Desulfovermiculus sp.]
MHIVNTIVPIFVVIVVGVVLRRLHYLPQELLAPLNRLVYYLAIPAMIFHQVASASWAAHFQWSLLAATLVPALVVFALAVGIAWLLGLRQGVSGTFIQCSFHGNLGYIGLAVCFYALGDQGLTRASILAGFLMLVQNLLAVTSLLISAKSEQGRPLGRLAAAKIVLNPVILSAVAGIVFSMTGLDLPTLISRSLQIVSGMALPLALMVIGASLSFHLLRRHLALALSAGALKLLLLPGLGLLLAAFWGLDKAVFAPALLLLAGPTATVTVVMAGEMGGAPELASAAVALNTLISAASYTLWLSLL